MQQQMTPTPRLIGKRVEEASDALPGGVRIEHLSLDHAKSVIRYQSPAPGQPMAADGIVRVYATQCITIQDYTGRYVGDLETDLQKDLVTLMIHHAGSNGHVPVTPPDRSRMVGCNSPDSEPGDRVCAGGEIAVMLDGCQAGWRKWASERVSGSSDLAFVGAPLLVLLLGVLIGGVIGRLIWRRQ